MPTTTSQPGTRLDEKPDRVAPRGKGATAYDPATSSQRSIKMKALIAGTLAAGIVLASSTFAQQPPPGGLPAAPPPPAAAPGMPAPPGMPPTPGVNKGQREDHAQYHQQWEDCMARQEAKYGGVKTVGQHAGANSGGQHAGANKGNWKGSSKGKPLPPDEKRDAQKGEKENRHQAEMDDCREQLYGRDAPAPGKK